MGLPRVHLPGRRGDKGLGGRGDKGLGGRDGLKGPALAPTAREVLELAKGEHVLAAALDDNSGSYVVATTYAIAVVSAGGERTLRRPWHLVDAGVWQPETYTLSVTWTDGHRPAQWTFRDQRTLLPEVLRERVQGSVVLATRLLLGDRRTGRVAIRKDFATRELIPQVVLGRGVRPDAPDVQAQVQAAMADLKDQVGLPD